MSEIVINPAIIEKYLINIVWRLNGVKLDSVAMDFTGNASGLNSFAYAYCRISNLLVSYRDLVRSDIHCVCEGVSALLYEDGSIADSISNDSIDGLVSFGEDLMNRIDAIGAVSPPSIYTSSFTLNYQDMSFFENVLTSQVSELCDNLFRYKESIKSLCETSAFMGDTAESIKAYWRDVHIPIVDALLALSVEIVERYSEFVFNLDVLIDEQNDCNIPQSILGIYIETLTSINGRLEIEAEEILNRIREYSSSYSEFSSSDPDVQLVTNALLQLVSTIACLAETIYEYENSQADITKGFIDNAVEEIADLFNGLQDVSIMCYTTNAIEDISGYDFVCELSASVDTDHLRQRTVELYIDASEGDYRNLSNSQIEYIQDYVDIVYANRYSDCENVIQLRAVNLGQIETYIRAYELLNPGQAELVNEFLNPISQLATVENGYADDVQNITYLLYSAPEPYRTLYIQSLDSLTIDFIDEKASNYNGNQLLLRESAYHYVEGDYPYLTLFHELGHVVDDRSVVGYESEPPLSCNPNYVNEQGMTLYDVLEEEMRSVIENDCNRFFNEYDGQINDNDREMIINHLISRERFMDGDYPDDWGEDVICAYDYIRTRFGYQRYHYEEGILYHLYVSGMLSDDLHSPLSDIYAALTNNEIGGVSGHYFDEDEYDDYRFDINANYTSERLGEFIENYSYWWNETGLRTSVASEYFAEYSSNAFLGYEDRGLAYQELTGESASFIDSLYRDLRGGESL